MSQHQAKFTWGAGPNSVHIAGNFNDWSDSATPLKKLEDGSFAADVPLPWGEKQAFKYVVDGEWKVREDEAKEWDAAGNMNNVYTAPHAPAPSATESSTAPAAAAAAPSTTAATAPVPSAAAVDTKTAPTTDATAVPVAESKDTAPITKSESTEPSTLLASSAPSAASAGQAPVLGGPILGQPVAGTRTTEPVKATAAVPIEDAPAVTAPTPVKIEQVAANANIGQAPVGEEQHTLQETVAQYGAGALGAIGGVLGGAVIAVEKATGIDLGHGNPLTIEEARAQGIDVNTIPKHDAETDAVSPVGSKPPADAVAALEEKTRQLRVDQGAQGVSAVPLPHSEPPKSSHAKAPESTIPTSTQQNHEHDLPAQNETGDQHKSVPAPVIVPVSGVDPKKDRSLHAPNNSDTAGTKPISADPAVSAVDAKREAEAHPGGTGSTPAVATGTATSGPTGIAAGEAAVSPNAPEKNIHVDSPPTPPKDPKTSTAPSTPAKTAAAPGTASATSTPASTPAKAGHGKEATGGSDVRKRKSSFFTKIKHAFSPKDKEKK